MKAHYLFSLAVLAATQLSASVSVRLTAPAFSVPVGTTLTFTATGTDSKTSDTRFSYQFTMRSAGIGSFMVIQDYYFDNTFSWTESKKEGWYDIGVTAWSEATHDSGATYMTVYVNSRVTGNQPVVSNTANSMVGLYSAPACSAPNTMAVRFAPGSFANRIVTTPSQTCNGLSMNFYVAGLLADTKYVVQHVIYESGGQVYGPELNYTSGTIPSTVSLPAFFNIHAPEPPTSQTNPYLLRAIDGYTTFATDLNQNVVWYLEGTEKHNSGYLTHITKDGTFLIIEDDRTASAKVCPSDLNVCGDHRFLRERDVAGNVIRETNWSILKDRVNFRRAHYGKASVTPNFIHHEGIRLPNGYTITLMTDEQVRNQGAGPVDVLGDVIVVLDQNLDVVWTWDVFDYLPISRLSVLPASICMTGSPGCPPQFHNVDANGQLYKQANDWTHTNSVFYDASDGNLIVSMRNQSWVLKISFTDGTGDGHIIWKLGAGGTFSLPAGYPVSTWQSGQHDPEIQPNGLLSLFDNNNPSTVNQQPGGNSHGQAWSLDTRNMIATPIVNVDLGAYSYAVGSAALLPNGNYTFDAGFIGGTHTQTTEVTPSGAYVYQEQTNGSTYRTFRLRDLYTPTHTTY